MAADEDDRKRQALVVAALESGRATGDPQPLRRLDTHMSNIFLTPQRAYKLKRALRHPFADMSTCELRRRDSETELEVNRRLAPGMYLCVEPVTLEPDGGIRVGGSGEVVDWLVVMRRFADGALLDEMARAGTLTAERITEAADVVARFHADLPPIHEAGHAVDYRRIVEGLRRTEAQGAGAIGVRPAASDLFELLEREISRHGPLIELRRRQGFVRRGHGDLHLRNICVFEERVTPFDALEFSAALATADVLHDLAFLLMDLHAHGLPRFANLAMNRYWDASGQPEAALVLLPLFMGLRAAVRMAVAVEAGDLIEADRYHALGLRLLRPSHPRLVAIGGLSGTGKSTVAAAVAPDLPGPCGGRLLRSDVIRKSAASATSDPSLPAVDYSLEARARIYSRLAESAHEALAAGVSVVADATFREAPARALIEGVGPAGQFNGFWLRAPLQARLGRIAGRRGDASDATPDIARAQTEPSDLGDPWRILDAAQPVIDLAAEVRSIIAPPS